MSQPTTTTTKTKPVVTVPSVGTTLSGTTWLATKSVVQTLYSDQAIASRLANSTIIEIVGTTSTPSNLSNVVPAVKFTSSAKLVEAINNHAIPSWAKAVIYDPEAWVLTPVTEQTNLVQATENAYNAATSAHLQFIVTPALDLARVIAPKTKPYWSAMVQSGIFGELAKYANDMVIQSQSLQSQSGVLQSFLSQAVEQAKSANPSISVLGGLTTNPRGATLSAAGLNAAYRLSLRYVSGVWFNIPGPGVACPTCPPPNPELAKAFFRSL